MNNRNNYIPQKNIANSRKSLLLLLLLIPLFLLIFVIFFLNSSDSPNHNNDYYGNWKSVVILSEDLKSVLDEDYNVKAYDAIESALDEYFLELYPDGTGINFTEYNSEKDKNTLRLISSYGTFHDLTILYNEEKNTSIAVKIDQDFNKTYDLNHTQHEEEEEE